MKEDWIECDLQEVCFSFKGKKPPILENKISEKINVPYINIKAFEKGIIDEYTDGNKCNLCEDGDLLMVWDGARAGLSGKARKGAVGSTLMKIEEVKGIEKQYLSYFLLSLYTKINTNPRGVGIPHVEPRILWYSKLLIVSSPIQRAIVSKIEALFSDLDNGIANFKKAQEQLKIYRQAVLKKAFEGELTKQWREKQTNLPTAEELLKQIKEERQNHYNEQIEVWKKAVKVWEKGDKKGKRPSRISKPKELPDVKESDVETYENLPITWQWSKFGNVTYKIGDIDHKMPKTVSNGYPYLSTGDLNKDGTIDFSGAKTISKEDFERLALKIKPEKGDIIFPRYGTIGRNILIDFDKEFLVSYACAIIKNIKGLMSSKFALYYSLSPVIKKEIKRYTVETTQANIGIASIENFVFPLCSTEEQNQIVQEIEFRLSVCDKVEQSINESIEKAEALRQSILKKAFEGKLLSKSEIELCKKEADYEPANELLKKIQAEKLAKELEKKKPITKKKSKK